MASFCAEDVGPGSQRAHSTWQKLVEENSTSFLQKKTHGKETLDAPF